MFPLAKLSSSSSTHFGAKSEERSVSYPSSHLIFLSESWAAGNVIYYEYAYVNSRAISTCRIGPKEIRTACASLIVRVITKLGQVHLSGLPKTAEPIFGLGQGQISNE